MNVEYIIKSVEEWIADNSSKTPHELRALAMAAADLCKEAEGKQIAAYSAAYFAAYFASITTQIDLQYGIRAKACVEEYHQKVITHRSDE